MFLDLGKSELAKLVKADNPSAVFFLLRSLGKARGYSERLVVEPTPELPRRNSEGVTRRLRAPSKDEIEQLERLVLKMEGRSSLEPVEGYDEVAEVAEVEAVAASGEVDSSCDR